jgi:hypothetical protein
MAPISKRPTMDGGERTLRRIARVGVVLALCWAAGGVYLATLLDPGRAVAWVIAIVAFAPLYLLYAVAGEVLGVRRVRRAMNALRFRLPPVLERRVGGPVLLLLVVPAALALAWLIVGSK